MDAIGLDLDGLDYTTIQLAWWLKCAWSAEYLYPVLVLDFKTTFTVGDMLYRAAMTKQYLRS